ncbi:hypothetical protein [Pseudomonas viridiflava]|uniref:hypothetical protein n=1 Tax=Pseudomonas viridiflava TaxID=33069 RepID=UPI000F024851|nr:hypothetical protein [Pseudomonas viridiflava]
MKASNSQATLKALASAVEASYGLVIDPDSTQGREQLLSILQELVEDPMKHPKLLQLMVLFNKSSGFVPKPWPKGAKPRLADTADIPDHEDFYLEGLHYGRSKKPEVAQETRAERVVDRTLSELMARHVGDVGDIASPSSLGFDVAESLPTFNRRLLGIALEQVENSLTVVWKRHPRYEVRQIVGREKRSVDPDTLPIHTQQYELGDLRLRKSSRAKNSEYVKVDHEKYNIQVAFVGSGSDLYLRVAVNERDVLAARESLSDTPHLTNALVTALSDHPDAGLEIVKSMLEDYPSPRKARERDSGHRH